MGWNLFLDDIRNPEYVADGRDYVIARSFDEAVKLVEAKGLPDHIAFDHDLGWDEYVPEASGLIVITEESGQAAKSGFDFAKWLVEKDLDFVISIPVTFSWGVHSSNPEGAKNIDGLLRGYMRSKYPS